MVTWNAADYNRHSEAQRTWARELIAKLGLTGSERVLDIGCGDGKVTAEIKLLVPRGSVLGVDKSEDMVRFAASAFPAEQWPGLSFGVRDASALGFENEFDLVFSNATLHWVIDHRPVLRGVAHALAPGGRCFLQMGGRGNAQPIVDVVTRGPWARYFEGMRFPYGFYGPEEYLPWLREAGLTPKRVELLPRDMVQPGRDGLAGWFRTTWMPFTNRVPEADRERFVAEVVGAYLAQHPLDDQGRAHVPMFRLEAEATV